jgi:dolichol-phosphate mannosyltransferase
MSHSFEISVVVPMHNEAGHVAALMDEIAVAVAHLGPVQIIAVDDASTDRTADELSLAQQRIPRLSIVRHDRNAGQSQALITGVLAADAPWVITLDGDGQNDPADIARLIAARDGTPAPERTLFIGYRAYRAKTAKSRASKVANIVRMIVLNDNTPDSGCGLKLFQREMFLKLPRFDALHRFMPALVIRAGGKVVSVPIRHRPRTYGQSHYGILGRGLVGIIDLIGVFWLMKRHTSPKR